MKNNTRLRALAKRAKRAKQGRSKQVVMPKCDIVPMERHKATAAELEPTARPVLSLEQLQIELNKVGLQILAYDNLLHIKPIPGREEIWRN